MAVSVRRAVVILALLFGAGCVLLPQAWVGAQDREAPVPEEPVEVEGSDVISADRLIVTYEAGSPESAEGAAVEKVAGEVERDLEAAETEVVEVADAERAAPGEERKAALRSAKEDLEDEPGVAGVEYDYARASSYVPSDPGFPQQWGLKRTDLPRSWGSTGGNDGAGVRIAVVDSGVDANHPDLRGKVVAQRDFVGGDGVAQDDPGGHGTHVAGIAAAGTGNGAGVSGGCPDCDLIVAKVMKDGTGHDSDIIAGIIWAADMGAGVINLSLNGPAPSEPLRRAMEYARGKGAVVVAATGNTGDGVVQYPAAYSAAVAVAATDPYDRRAYFSTHGAWVDVSAPGVDVLSLSPGGGYRTRSGTSMATPHVAALAGLLLSRGLTADEARNRILSGAADTGPTGRDPYVGAGRMDAVRSLWPSASPPQPPAPENAAQDAAGDRANDANAAPSGGDPQRTLAAEGRPAEPQEAEQTRAAPPRREPAPTVSPDAPAREEAVPPRPPEVGRDEPDSGRDSRRITFAEGFDEPVAPAPDVLREVRPTQLDATAPVAGAEPASFTLTERAMIGVPCLLLLALLLAARRFYGRRLARAKAPKYDGGLSRSTRHRSVEGTGGGCAGAVDGGASNAEEFGDLGGGVGALLVELDQVGLPGDEELGTAAVRRGRSGRRRCRPG